MNNQKTTIYERYFYLYLFFVPFFTIAATVVSISFMYENGLDYLSSIIKLAPKALINANAKAEFLTQFSN
jgi:hypothetical protein